MAAAESDPIWLFWRRRGGMAAGALLDPSMNNGWAAAAGVAWQPSSSPAKSILRSYLVWRGGGGGSGGNQPMAAAGGSGGRRGVSQPA